jgi:lauroyl/myristoyl acyltransferase
MSLLATLRRALRPGGDTVGAGVARNDVALCRAIEPRGWEHVHAADARGHGTVLLVAGGNRSLALRAVSLWLPPVEVTADDLGEVSDVETAPMLEAVSAALGAGKRVVVTAHEPGQAITHAAALARSVGCAVVPVAARTTANPSTLTLGVPITAAPDEGQAALESRLLSSLEALP